MIGRNRKNKASMSFWTSLGLSANNLRTKKGRTFMTAFAGSIGIIGIALILALSSGVNEYIQSIEEDTLSEYPLQITSSAFDFSSLLSAMSGSDSGADSTDSDAEISVIEIISTIFSQINSNDLTSLKKYIDDGNSRIGDYTTAIEYIYDLDPQIYITDGDNIRQVNPDTTMGSSGSSMFSSLFSSYASVSSFYAMPENASLYESKYEVVAGHWPENYNECVLVLTSDGSVSDYLLYTLGLRDYSELESILERYYSGEDIGEIDALQDYSYDDVLGITYKAVCAADYYALDSEYGVWVDKTDDESYLADLVENGETLTIVGVVQPGDDSSGTLTSGINYPVSLVYHMAELAEESAAVKAQLADPETNIFTGGEFGESSSDFDMASLISVDDDALSGLFDTDSLADSFEIDPSALNFSALSIGIDAAALSDELPSMEDSLSSMDIDLSSMDIDLSSMDIDLSSLDIDLSSIDLSSMIDLSSIDISSLEIDMSGLDLSSIVSGISFDISAESMSALATQILEGYQIWMSSNGGASYSDLASDFSAYLTSANAASVISEFLKGKLANAEITVPENGLSAAIEAVISAAGDDEDTDAIASAITEAVTSYINENADVSINITEADIQELANALLADYASYAQANGLTTPDSINNSFSEYLRSDTVRQMVAASVAEMIGSSVTEEQIYAAMDSYMQDAMSAAVESYVDSFSDTLEKQISSGIEEMAGEITEEISAQITDIVEQIMQELMSEIMTEISDEISASVKNLTGTIMEGITSQLSGSMESMVSQMMGQMMDEASGSLTDSLSIDADALADSFDFSMDSNALMEMLTSMSSSVSADYESNLQTLGYIDYDTPDEIDIYPIDFEAKDQVVAILDGYNADMEQAGESEKVISYTDMVATMMSSVTTIINVVTYVLIAFVAVSLIVSCIMISIITQISTMERTKEIGILRAMGASKNNVSQVFIAETFIIGCGSGLLGVGITELLIIPINRLIHGLTGDTSVNAVLPLPYAVILVIISIAITVISGLVPALSAAKKDPVTSLRTE